MKKDTKLHLVVNEQKSYHTKCEICGNNTSSLTKRCNPCWQCEHRLVEYLKHAKGRQHVSDILMEMYTDER